MVILSADQEAVTPEGNPMGVPIPVAPVVLCVIGVIFVPIQGVGVTDCVVTVLLAFTLMVPVALIVPQPPVRGMEYKYVAADVGIPLIVIMLSAQVALTPGGRPEAVPIPVAPVVKWVILVNGVLIQRVGDEDGAPTVLSGVTLMVPVALIAPQPPVKGMIYKKGPDAVGVPLIVMVLPLQVAVIPAGKPAGVPIPVAPVVVCVIGGMAVLMQVVVEDGTASVTVLRGETIKVPVAKPEPQPPSNGIV